MKHPIKYLWEKLNYIDGSSGLFLFLVISTMVLLFGGIFWFNSERITNFDECRERFAISSTPDEGGYCTVLNFDGHGVGAVGWLVITLILLEILFFIYLFVNKKPFWRSWAGYTFLLKLKALGDVLLVYIVVFPILYFIPKSISEVIENWEVLQETFIKIFIALGVILLIILLFLLNVLLSKVFSKELPRKFKVGDKVRVRKDLEPGEVYGGKCFYDVMGKLKGKIVEITSFDKDKIDIKEDKGDYSWREEMFEELKGGKKNVKRK